MDVIIYVVYHDDNSYAMALSTFGGFKWARLISIPSTKYCESIVFGFLEQNKDEWQNSHFVGIVTYSFTKKIPIETLVNVIDDICCQKYNEFDIIGLRGLDEPIEKSHPGIEVPLTVLIEAMGKQTIKLSEVRPFYSNYWLAKPNVFRHYLRFFKEIKNIMEENTTLSNILNQNSGYPRPRNARDLIATFGYPWYTWHPFISERLICIFTDINRYNLVTIPITDYGEPIK